MKIIVEMQAVTWSIARTFSTYKGGRLLTPAELQQLSKSRSMTVDVWTCEENEEAPETAKFWCRTHQAIRSKNKEKLCLLVYAL